MLGVLQLKVHYCRYIDSEDILASEFGRPARELGMTSNLGVQLEEY